MILLAMKASVKRPSVFIAVWVANGVGICDHSEAVLLQKTSESGRMYLYTFPQNREHCL